MSANTLTNLIPTIYEALDIVSRELVGFIPAVARNSSLERAAVDEPVRYPIVPAMSAADITPAATGPDATGVSVGSDTMTISASRSVSFPWNGEEQKGLNNAGIFGSILRDEFAQAMRTLVNEVETDVAELYVNASRAYGTAGTAPFGSDLSAAAYARKILDDNGAPQIDRHIVIDTAAGAKLRLLTQLTKANEAGDDSPLRRGVLLDLLGFAIRESGQVQSHTKGTGSSYQINNAYTEAVGQTTLTVDTGSGTIIAGDILTHADDTTNKYVVKTALSGGDVVIQNPGLLVAASDDAAVAVGNSYTANLAFHRSAIQLVTRIPALPEGGDSAADRMIVQDPVSGLGFDVAMYKQYRQVSYEVALCWGCDVVKPEHLAIILG